MGALIKVTRGQNGEQAGFVLRFHDGRFPTVAVIPSASSLEVLHDLGPPKEKPPTKLLLRHKTPKYVVLHSSNRQYRCPLTDVHACATSPDSNPSSQPHSYIMAPPSAQQVSSAVVSGFN